MSHLSEALKKYYERSGNKMIFKNNYSLNKLALEMWAKLGYRGFDSSSLSRVINGKRLFTQNQLKAFCQILNITSYKKNHLFEAFEQDYLQRFGFKPYSAQQSTNDILDLLKLDYECIHYARERSNFGFVNDWTDHIVNKIDEILKRGITITYERKLNELLGNILYEKGYVNASTLPSMLNMKMSLPIFKKIVSIARHYNIPELSAKGYTLNGFAYYSLANYSIGASFKKLYWNNIYLTKKALNMLPMLKKTAKLALICWRHIAMSSIYIKNEYLFDKSENEINKLINNESDDYRYVALTLHTLARGKSILDRKGVFDTINQSKMFLKKIDHNDALYKASIIRNEIEILNNLKSKNTYEINRLANQGFLLSKESGVNRFIPYFSKFVT